ncbi:MAG: mannose-1-phosphate guanylyltransferase/mannose-6-phosphate isomerase [Lentisphaeraceae bacterium]|nr:mannose-1-phosphate guanylyltransferase/mannose-6-phosphate isomerase [Lentisphaeraceae bacterium]
MILPVIMAGGTGSRLWPSSRELYPKQFLPLVSENTMIQDTILRLDGIKDLQKPLFLCNEDHRFLVAEQLREISCEPDSIILEPVGRNTAPAIALAALKALQNGEDPLLLVLAADHMISSPEVFHSVVEKAKSLAESGKLVTFGIVPTAPETGYGYICQGEDVEEVAYKVASFEEKPTEEVAQKYLKSGNYLWNSGMFLIKASVYLSELKKYAPEIYNMSQESFESSESDRDFLRVSKESFEKCPSDSIDYAVMEHTSDAVVLPLDAGWNDVGSWSSLWEVSPKDENGNVSNGDVILEDTENSMVFARKRQVCTLGLKNTVVIETADSVLVADKGLVENVKKITEQLKKSERQEVLHHRQVCRPWGKFDSIDSGERFQVKHITVNPGEKLSRQLHHHRAEHWVVVSGTAKVVNGDQEIVLSENQSTYIPIGAVHSLENPGKIPLELIEVQSGSYLGEDDIVRLDDRYGRD